MTDDEILALAVKHKLGRTLKPIGLDTGDVFYTDASYRTAELLDFARELLAHGVTAVAPINRAACEVERDASKCWRQPCADAGVCTAAAADPDGEAGIAWWNGLNDEDRRYWLALSLGTAPADAWDYFKRCGAAGLASPLRGQQP